MIVVLDKDNKIFMIYIATLVEPANISIYICYKTQVILLKKGKILAKYSHFFDISFSNFAIKLLKYTRINNYTINLYNLTTTLQLNILLRASKARNIQVLY